MSLFLVEVAVNFLKPFATVKTIKIVEILSTHWQFSHKINKHFSFADDSKAVEKLIADKVNINNQNSEGVTPLHIASHFGK